MIPAPMMTPLSTRRFEVYWELITLRLMPSYCCRDCEAFFPTHPPGLGGRSETLPLSDADKVLTKLRSFAYEQLPRWIPGSWN